MFSCSYCVHPSISVYLFLVLCGSPLCCGGRRVRDMHSSEKYVVIIIFRMAICHLFPSSYLLLPHSWCCEAGWERTVVGVQGGWRTVVWAKSSDQCWRLWGRWVWWWTDLGVDHNCLMTCFLFYYHCFSSPPFVAWMIFQCLIHLQVLQQIIPTQHEWQNTFKISTQH